jgi:AcrR family transcriptional regulator
MTEQQEPELEEWLQALLKLEEKDRVSDKQIRIVQAAVEIFSEKGYASTSTSEIAQKAGVAEGTIFKHYRTKKELLLRIVSPIMSKLVKPFVLRDFIQVLDSSYPTFEDFLRAMIRNRFEFARKHLPIIKVMLQEIPFHPELKQLFVDNVAQHVVGKLEQTISRYQESGSIRSDIPPTTVLRLMASVILGYLASRFIALPEFEWDDEKETEYMVSFILNGLSTKIT